MLTSTLLLMLSAADGHATFLADGAPRKIRLVDDEAPVGPTAESYAGWTRGQLQAEYDRIAEARPGLGLPIGLMAGGGVATFVCLYAMFITAVTSAFSGGSGALPFYILFGVGSIVGIAVIIIGVILLVRSLPDRRQMGHQLDLIENLINNEAPALAPVPIAPPPPPALPPPQVSLPFPITLARF